MVFIITCQKVEKGKELLGDYGPSFGNGLRRRLNAEKRNAQFNTNYEAQLETFHKPITIEESPPIINSSPPPPPKEIKVRHRRRHGHGLSAFPVLPFSPSLCASEKKKEKQHIVAIFIHLFLLPHRHPIALLLSPPRNRNSFQTTNVTYADLRCNSHLPQS